MAGDGRELRAADSPPLAVESKITLAHVQGPLMIARAHGGDIEVESTVGKGTAFRVRLPLLIVGGSVRSLDANSVDVHVGNGDFS
jgi:hypothetical protein